MPREHTPTLPLDTTLTEDVWPPTVEGDPFTLPSSYDGWKPRTPTDQPHEGGLL